MAIVQRKDLFSPQKQQPEYFSDFFTDLDIHPIKKDLVRHTNDEAVKTSIRNLLSTNRGDRLFNPTLGSDVRSMLFENFSPSTERIIEQHIQNTIDNYEPRAEVQSIRVLSDEDGGYMIATIIFGIINKQEPITLELILNRIR